MAEVENAINNARAVPGVGIKSGRQVAVTTENGDPGVLDTSLTKTTAQVILAAAIGGVVGYTLRKPKDSNKEYLRSLEDEIFALDSLLDSAALKDGGSKDLADVRAHVTTLRNSLAKAKEDLDTRDGQIVALTKSRDDAMAESASVRSSLAEAVLAWERFVAASSHNGNFHIGDDLATNIAASEVNHAIAPEWAVRELLSTHEGLLADIASKFGLGDYLPLSENNVISFLNAVNGYVEPVYDDSSLRAEIEQLRQDKTSLANSLDEVVAAFNNNRSLSKGHAATGNTVSRRIRDFVAPAEASSYDVNIGPSILEKLGAIHIPTLSDAQRGSDFPKRFRELFFEGTSGGNMVRCAFGGYTFRPDQPPFKTLDLVGDAAKRALELTHVLASLFRTHTSFTVGSEFVPYSHQVSDSIMVQGVYNATYAYLTNGDFASFVDAQRSSLGSGYAKAVIWDAMKAMTDDAKKNAVALAVLLGTEDTLAIVRDNRGNAKTLGVINAYAARAIAATGNWEV